MKRASTTPPSSFDRVFEHLLLRVDDLGVLILKGHLIVEEILFDLLAERVFNDRAALSAADLTFAKKLQLCRAWAPLPEAAATWDLIGALNVLRNDMAHALDTPKRLETLRRIRELYEKANPSWRTTLGNADLDDEHFLLTVFAFVSGVLLAIARPNGPPPSEASLLRLFVSGRRT